MYRRQDLDSSFYTSLTILFSENLNFPASDDLPFADFLTSDISTDHDTSVEELAAIAKKCVTAELSASQKEQKSATSQWQIQKEQERDGLYEPLIGLKSACLFQGSWEAASQSMSEMVEENARCNANKSIKTRLRKNALSRPGPKSLNSVNGQQNSLYLNSCKFKPSKHRSKAPRGVMRSKWMHTGGVRGGHKVLRSRSGCWTCRIRHKACPEDGVVCSTCLRLRLECDTSPERPGYMTNKELAAERLAKIRSICRRPKTHGSTSPIS